MDQARLEQIKQRVEAVQDKFRSQDERDLLDLLAAIAEARATVEWQAAELSEARKDQAWMREVDQLYGDSLSALPAWSDETASLEDNIRHMAEELSRLRADAKQAFAFKAIEIVHPEIAKKAMAVADAAMAAQEGASHE